MSGRWFGISRGRVVIGAAGVLLGLFGVFRLVTEVDGGNLVALAVWLAGALVLHDALLSPSLVGIGVLLGRLPVGARRYAQAGLIAAGLVTVIALPLIYRTGSQPRVKAILNQDYRVNLLVLLAIILVAAVAAYLRRAVHDRRRGAATGSSVEPGEGADADPG